ncbi:MAG: hypothetical protein ACK5LV_02745 [Lachnospirales bacterium]
MNKFKMKSKKLIATVLAFTFAFTAFQSVPVYADKQKAVTGTSIIFDSKPSENLYNYVVGWNKVTDSGVSDGSGLENVTDETGATLFTYNVQMRSEGSGTYETIYSTTDKMDKYTYNVSRQLDSGKFFYHRVVANHQHLNTETGESTEANQETPLTSLPEAIFMSDLDLEVKIEGRELTFTWDNPKISNLSPFDSYSVFYSISDTESSNTINASTGNKIEINTKDASQTSDGKLTYKYYMSDLKVGKFYSFKIEPNYEGDTLRGVMPTESPQSSIKVGDKTYKIAYSTNEYRDNGVYVKPNLYIESINSELIKLYWDSFDATSMDVEDFRLELYSDTDVNGDSLTGNKKLIAVIDNFNITSWIEDAPNELTYYQFIMTVGDIVVESNIAIYDESYDKFSPYSPTIRTVTKGSGEIPFFNFTWDSFIRFPLGDEIANVAPPLDDMYEDKNIDYKAWITDSIENFDKSNMIDYFYNFTQSDTPLDAKEMDSSLFKYIDGEGTEKSTLVYDSKDVSEFKNINQYVSYESGYPVMKNLEENKVYYIKIQAFRKGAVELSSEAAYSSVYIPSIDDIVTRPEMLQRPPLRILLDDKGSEVVTTESIAIAWDRTWFEVNDEKTPSTWYSVIGVDTSGKVLYGENAINSIEDEDRLVYLNNYPNEEDMASIRDRLKVLGVPNWDTIPLRYVDYSKTGSELHVVEYNSVSDYESYIASLTDEDYTEISPTVVDNNFTYNITGLSEDTSYLIVVRSYYYHNGEKYYTYLPQYVVGATTGDITEVPETPTSPIIEGVSSTSTSVTVRFITNDYYNNVLKISDNFGDYSAGGTVITSEMIKENGKIVQIEGKDEYYVYYTIENLFPQTTYYLWVNNTIGSNTSDWSTATDIQTKEIDIPNTPTGLSIISKDILANINKANTLNYERIDKNYLILEWARVAKDTEIKTTSVESYNQHEILQDLSTQRFVSVKFNDLESYQDYYTRVRTIFTVSKNGIGSNVFYSYEIEISKYADFKDSQKVIVYSSGLVPDNFQVLQAVSPWSKVYTFKTGQDLDEYDGFNDPDKYPLPDTSFEITFDDESDTLQYVFRAGGTDSTGANNNYVDQRFISEMALQGYTDYFVDLSSYNNKDIKNREVVVPYSVLNSLSQYKTTLTVKNDNLIVEYDFDDFDNYLNSQGVYDFGGQNTITFKASEVTNYGNVADKTVASNGHDLSALVETSRTTTLEQMPNTMDMALKLNSRAEAVDSNIGVYTREDINDSFDRVASTYNSDEGVLEFATKNLDTFVAFKSSNNASAFDFNDYYYSVATKLNINDIAGYSGNDNVNTTQFNNIIASVLKGESDVNMNSTLSNEDYVNLGRANLLASGTYVNRESGIVSVLRLYEKKTGSRLNATNINSVPNINSVSSENKESVAKAYDIALFDDSKGYNYSESLSFDELFYMLDMVVNN